MSDQPPQRWMICVTCDVRFLSRSRESLEHAPKGHEVKPEMKR